MVAKPTICVLSPDLISPLLGNARMAWELLEELDQSDYSVCAITNSNENETDVVTTQGIEVLKVPASLTKPYYFPRSIRAIRTFVNEQEVDVLHGHGIFMSYFTALAQYATDTPAIQTINGTWPVIHIGRQEVPVPDLIKYLPLRTHKHVICSSEYLRNIVQEHGVKADNTSVLRYGVDDVWFRTTKTETEFDVIFFGDGNWERGLFTLTDAIPYIITEHPDTKIAISIRHWREGVKSQVLEQIEPYRENITLFEYPNQDPIEELVARSSIVALPYRVNSMEPPISLIESLAMGKPVITSNIGANPELIGSNDRGLLIPPDDAEALARNLSRLLDDDGLRNRYGREASEFVNQKYKKRDLVSKLREIYRVHI